MGVELPKIDVSNPELIPGTATWELVRRDVLNAVQEFGAFECIHRNHLVPSTLYQALIGKEGLVEEVFNLPVHTKKRFLDSGIPFDGYVGGLKWSPLTEMMGINRVLDSPAINDLSFLFWPHQGHPKFSDSTLAYVKKLQVLEVMVKRMVFEELGVEKYLEAHMESAVYLLRMNKYVAPDTEEEQLGSPVHTDKSFLTILQQNHVNGLEVQTKDGLWFKVSPSSPPNSSFIVFAGDSFKAWSNGRIHCAPHRVVMRRGSDTRYSIGLFSSSKGTVQCPEELVDDEHPLLFKPFNEVEMLRFIQKEAATRISQVTLNTYCGVN